MLKIEFPASAIAVLAACMIAMSGTAWAQSESAESDTPTQAEDAAPEATAAADGEPGTAADVESQLSLGENAGAADGAGEPYTKEVNGAWELRCLRTETPEEDPCQMYQLLDDGQGQPVAEVSLFRLPGDGRAKAGATVIVPLETALPAQLTIQVDGGAAKRYPYAFCNQLGCYSRIGLTEEDVNTFKRGREAVMTIIPALAPDQEVRLSLSLDGFTASYDKVSIIEQ